MQTAAAAEPGEEAKEKAEPTATPTPALTATSSLTALPCVVYET